MGHIRVAVTCAVSTLGITMTLVAGASGLSLPEWGQCLKSPTGAYRDAGCTEKVGEANGGQYAWHSTRHMADKHLAIEGGEAVLEGVSGKPVTWAVAGLSQPGGRIAMRRAVRTLPPNPTTQECDEARGEASNEWDKEVEELLAKENSSGPNFVQRLKEIGEKLDMTEAAITAACEPKQPQPGEESELIGAGIKELANLSLSFRGCSTSFPECGELRTARLRGALGFISGGGSPSPSVGLDLKPQHPDSGPFATFAFPSAGGIVGRARHGKRGDSVISRITPIDEMTTMFTQTYSESAPGVQDPTKFEDGKEDVLEMSLSGSGGFEQTALTLTTSDTTREPVEIRAYCEGC